MPDREWRKDRARLSIKRIRGSGRDDASRRLRVVSLGSAYKIFMSKVSAEGSCPRARRADSSMKVSLEKRSPVPFLSSVPFFLRPRVLLPVLPDLPLRACQRETSVGARSLAEYRRLASVGVLARTDSLHVSLLLFSLSFFFQVPLE